MDVHLAEALRHDPDARAVWVHELRNVVNRIGLHMALAQRLLEKERGDDAIVELAEGRSALADACELVSLASSAVAPAQGHHVAEMRDATGDMTH